MNAIKPADADRFQLLDSTKTGVDQDVHENGGTPTESHLDAESRCRTRQLFQSYRVDVILVAAPIAADDSTTSCGMR
jgi:hypothetical protein